MRTHKKHISFTICLILMLSHIFSALQVKDICAETVYDFSPFSEIQQVTTGSSITIKFDLNIQGSIEEIEPQTVNRNHKVIKPEDPVKEGTETESYEFLGWAVTTSSAITLWDFDKTVNENLKEEDNEATTTSSIKLKSENQSISKNYIKELTLWAQWKEIDLLATGTKENPFIINNSFVLETLSQRVNEGNSYEGFYFKLGKDINLNGPWAAIGNKQNPFKGNFDGNFHTINNIKIDTNGDYQGLFGFVESGTICNVAVSGEILGNNYVGSIAGYTENTTISTCYSTALVEGKNYVGGITGASNGSSKYSSCFINNKIIGAKAGAIVSQGFENNENCYYLNESIENPVDNEFVHSKDTEEFKSGEVAYLLDKGDKEERTAYWSQGETHPIFATETNKEIYKINSEVTGEGSIVGETYSIAGKEIQLEVEPTEGNLTKIFTVVGKSNEILVEGSGKDICKFTMPSSDINIKAIFVPKTADKFTVTFNGNGGFFKEGEESLESKIFEVVAGEKAIEPESLPTIQEDENTYYYKVAGWFTDKECTQEYNFNFAISENITLYAKWEAVTEIRVKFNSNSPEVTTNPEDQIIPKNKLDKILDVENPIWENTEIETHDFLGWSKVQSGEGSGVYWNFATDNISTNLKFIDKETNTLILHGQWKVTDLFTTGTKESPFKIYNVGVLSALASKVNAGNRYENCYFELAQNIDLSTFGNWIPIGNETNPFAGNFSAGIIMEEEKNFIENFTESTKSIFSSKEVSEDNKEARYYEITGLSIEGEGGYCGFFGNMQGGVIENLKVRGFIKAGNNIGGLVGNTIGNTKMLNCTSDVILIGQNYVGGIIGKAGDNVKLENCINITTTSAIQFTGGILGSGGDNVTLLNCTNSQNIEGKEYVAGIAGGLGNNAILEECVNEGEVNGGEEYISGIASKIGDNAILKNCGNTGASLRGSNYVAGIVSEIGENLKIYNSFNIANIEGKSYVGGVIGKASGKINSIINTYNKGNITSNGDKIGGIAGYLSGAASNIGKITGCYNEGNIDGGNYTGGLFGQVYSKAPMGDSIQRCYNAGNIDSDGKYVGGIIAYLPKGSRITDCYNIGNINSTASSVNGVGGITGLNYVRNSAMEVPSSYVVNSYNYGKITAIAESKVGAITGHVEINKNKDCYYLNTSIDNPSDKDYVSSRSKEEFRSGEISHLLDKGDQYLRKSIWSQDNKGGYPIFTDRGNRPVYTVTLDSYSGGSIEVPKYIKAGVVASLYAEPCSGNIIEKVLVTDSEDNRIDVKILGNEANFIMPEDDITVNVSFRSMPTQGVHIVTFDSCGGTPVSPQSIKAGERVEEPSNPVKEGQKFLGWYINEELYNFTKAVTSSFILTAKWCKDDEVTVEFNVNRPEGTEGSVNPESITVLKNQVINRPEDPVWNGTNAVTKYVFDGWYTQRAGGDKWEFLQPVTKDIILYAQWIQVDAFTSATSPETAIEIRNAEELRILSERVNAGNTYEGCYINLGADIDLGTLADEWEAIGFHDHLNAPN